MKIVKDRILLKGLKKMAKQGFGNLVKAVVDVEEEIMVINGELHSDEEALLLQKGSKQKDLWGINLYPKVKGDDWIEFDAMINLRPFSRNFSRGVDDPAIRKEIVRIVNRLVKK